METPEIITTRLERTSRRQTKTLATGCPSLVKRSSRPRQIELDLGNGHTLILSLEDTEWLANTMLASIGK